MHRSTTSFSTAVVLALLVAATNAHAGPCDGGILGVRSGSSLDWGSSGFGHGNELASGALLGFEVVHRCTDDLSVCGSNSDCSNDDCQATCDCDLDTSCEIAGPAGPRQCTTTLDDCTTNADCPSGVACVTVTGPPMPFNVGGTPLCVLRRLDGPWTGDFDAASGELSAAVPMRWRVFLGLAQETPCPRCGAPAANPAIGDVFTCEGGMNAGLACTVEGVTATYGGTSSDCPPDLGANITGNGVGVRLSELTTGTATRTASLPCAQPGFTGNPLVPGSDPKCTDKTAPGDPVCASNADCRRCSGDSSVACTADTDCTGIGTCAESPDQPITCGYWCHCGFCDNVPTAPCFDDGDCTAGESCVAGAGSPTAQNAPQRMPNGCAYDGYICGGSAPERCESTTTSSCSDAPYVPCSENADCAAVSAGTCQDEALSCFEPRITRAGLASAPASHCRDDLAPCVTNVDCVSPGDVCIDDAAAVGAVALLCSAASSSSGVNTAAGLTGPGALTISGLVQLCRCDAPQTGCEALCSSLEPFCGDGSIDAGEQCDGGACCQSDCTLSTAGTPCRAGGDGCDLEEVCDGTSTTCPVDVTETDGTPCDDGLYCTTGDACSAGACIGAARDCDDANACTTDSCDEGADSCVAAETPLVGTSCLVAPKIALQIKDSGTAGKDKLAWRWLAGAPFLHSVLGNPLDDTTYTLCIYDQAAGVPSLAASYEIPPSASWSDDDSRGVLYKDKLGTSDGVTKVQIKHGEDGKTRVKLAAGGTSLALPGPVGSVYFEQTPSLVVQLVNSEGTCWTSDFTSLDTKLNTGDGYKAQVK